tara:strand:+ start:3504 stop:4091 length:588 start_codon:yes stop_codon:yes gene_type:complete
MPLLKKVSEVKKYEKRLSSTGTVNIVYENGECSISSDMDIMGIEINFRGKAIITPKLPDGWYLRGSQKKIIIFTMQNTPIKNTSLFTYEGTITLTDALSVNTDLKKVRTNVLKDRSDWGEQYWDLSSESGNWDKFKDIRPKGKVNQTSYVIDDDLPKIEKTKIRKTKFRKRVDTDISTQEGGSSGSSGGSSGGGY